MINLLPDEVKRDIKAARMNVILVQYNILMLSAVVAVLGLCLAFYIFLNAANLSAESTSNDNNAKAAAFNDVRAAADDYRNNLSIASKILDNSVSYTSVIFALTELLPEGVYLDSINLTANSFGQQTSFSAHARTYDLATKLKENFENSELFSNVYLQNVSQPSDGSSSGDFPVAIAISAKLSKVVVQ